MQVIWSKTALKSLSDIISYYTVNVNLSVARSIKNNILLSTYQLSKFPQSGAIEENLIELKEGHRFLVRGSYRIIYKAFNNKVYITDIFDSRQNPEKISIRNKK